MPQGEGGAGGSWMQSCRESADGMSWRTGTVHRNAPSDGV